MARTISLATPNEIGVPEAKQRITEGFNGVKADYLDMIGNAELAWEGDTAHVNVKALAQEATAQIAVTAEEIKIDIQLPWLLAGFANLIETIIKDRAGVLLPTAKPGETPPPVAGGAA